MFSSCIEEVFLFSTLRILHIFLLEKRVDSDVYPHLDSLRKMETIIMKRMEMSKMMIKKIKNMKMQSLLMRWKLMLKKSYEYHVSTFNFDDETRLTKRVWLSWLFAWVVIWMKWKSHHSRRRSNVDNVTDITHERIVLPCCAFVTTAR